MASIVLFGGTSEGRFLAEAFAETDLLLHVCVATEYGASLLPKCENIIVHTGRMDEEEIEQFLHRIKPEYCLDATHPYAAIVTEYVRSACKKEKISYLRVEREEEEMWQISDSEKAEEKGSGTAFYRVKDAAQAADFLKQTKGNILLTTGSKELEKFSTIPDFSKRCFARVLPTLSVMEKCGRFGLDAKHIIGMQGPFSEEMNVAMLKQTGASWLVTKASGKEGGYQEKCEAALRAGVHLLVIDRPDESSVTDEEIVCLKEAVHLLREKFALKKKRKVYVIGMGPGSEKLLTAEAKEALQKSEVFIGAERILNLAKNESSKPVFVSYKAEEILRFLQEHEQYKTAAIVYSGDIGFYSGAKKILPLLKEYEVETVSGISAPLYFLNKLGTSWEDTKLLSCHGQNTAILPMLLYEKRVCLLLGEKGQTKGLCETLLRFGMEHIRMTVGERLSYPEERIVSGLPKDLLEQEFDSLSVVLLENHAPKERCSKGIEDASFLRGKVPMTKQEIRTLSIEKLRLLKTSVVYDVGAGTGSVSVEAARFCEQGVVYAIERNPEAVRLLQENRVKFGVSNMRIIEGEAPACLEALPAPTHVFIGGSGGRLLAILEAVRRKNVSARIVLNAVTFDTIAQLKEVKERFADYAGMEILWVNAARNRQAGNYQMLQASNPVLLAAFGGIQPDREENG